MITVEQYREHILAGLEALPPVQLPLDECLGLTTASSTTAHVSVPPFTNSAMDGYAVRFEDVASATPDKPVTLQVVDDVWAGTVSDTYIETGQTQRVMTGALLPAGADAVVPVENTSQPSRAHPLTAEIDIYHSVAEGRNIRLAGEDVAEGDPVISRGVVLTGAALGSVAATGHGSLLVHPKPRVTVIATGAELQAPGAVLDRGQIHDSNSIMLAGLCEAAHAQVVTKTRSSDDVEEFDALIAEALEESDLIITSGGVSQGAYDVVKNSSWADQLHFHRVAMQPGKPQAYGHLDAQAGHRVGWIALPGNPVSAFVSWHIFIGPALAKLAGRDPKAQLATRSMVTGAGWKSTHGRRQHIPVGFTDSGEVVPVHRLGSGSHLIASLHLADGLAIIDAEVDEVKPGDLVEVLPVRCV